MTEMTFVITRADLLGPTKESVDRLMPWLQEELRSALGRLGQRVRLGNVTCVSAKRGWWTKHLKERVWSRGGAAWMVGKVNVGKSQLFEAIYPKGRLGDTTPSKEDGFSVAMFPREDNPNTAEEELDDDGGDLLPPLQPLKEYPDMPMVSSLPGTTASPIRIPFGNKKGELIDLPGLARSDLEVWVRPEHRKSLIMQSRIIPEQRSVPASKSLVLGGGLIRITPHSQDLHFLMYNFTPLADHLTSTTKAIQMQDQWHDDKQAAWTPGMENIGIEGLNTKMYHSGTFELKTDVSKTRAGPLTRKDSVNLTVQQLPFRVLSTDILIEGVGYIEIVCQVRKAYLEHSRTAKIHWAHHNYKADERKARGDEERARDEKMRDTTRLASRDPFAAMAVNRMGGVASDGLEHASPKKEPGDVGYKSYVDHDLIEPAWPAIDVFSPMGRFIGQREPIQGWLRNKPLVKPEHRRGRPRPSAVGWKKADKKKKAASQVILENVFKQSK